MQVFITGATGNIGSAVVAELLAHGHGVTALTRSERSRDAARAAGASTVTGALTDLDVLAGAAREADGVIHLAFANDFSSAEAVQAAVAEEAAAVKVLGEALIGSDKPFIVTAGTPAVEGRASTEADPLPHEGPVGGRVDTVEGVLALAGRGVRSAAVRLPRTVHQDGKGGFASILAQIARRDSVAGYPGDGTQRWPGVHSRDAATLFRLVLEGAPAGSSWHAVADEGDPVAALVEVIGRRLGLPVNSRDAEVFGPLGPVFLQDQPASSAVTRRELGWEPSHPGQLQELELLEP